MKIRTQIILVCFLIAVVPLSGIVVYSYYSSRRALEAAYHGEAKRMTAQMDRRLGVIRNDLEQRLAEVSALPALSDAKASQHDVRNILLTMGDAASLVDSLEIQPVHVEVPQVKIVEANPAEMPAPPTPPSAKAAAPVAASAHVAVAAPAAPPEPTMIDIPPPPRMPRFVMSEEQRAQLDEIRHLGRDLGTKWNGMTPEQRDEMQKQLSAIQEQFNISLQASQAEFQKVLQEKLVAREEQRRVRAEARRAEKEKVEVAANGAVAQAAPAGAPKPAAAPQSEPEIHGITVADRKKLVERERQATLVLGRNFAMPLHSKGAVVANISAHISAEEVIRRVLGAAAEDSSEIAFAVDRDGNLYTRNDDDRRTLDTLGVRDRIVHNKPLSEIENWIVALTLDPQSGLRVGVARPVGENLIELRNTAAKNFGVGMALVAWLLIGITPIASHMTRDVKAVTIGAERIARGDLMTRLPVTSRNEFGQLAATFNRMAEDLSLHQQTIVTQERERQEQALHQRLLEAEYARKSEDLEEARRFQLSLLPKHVPQLPRYDIAVFTQTAAEVGGDYYDFHLRSDDGAFTAAIGDATGHGARAGTMVTVIKALFAGYAPEVAPSEFLRDGAEKVKRMDLGRMSMALLVARFDNGRVTMSSAGMPPAYVHRRGSGEVDEIALHATPLGTLGADYRDAVIELAAGDTLLLMSDGFPELLNAGGQQLGYVAAAQEFAEAAKADDADGVIAALADAARRWHGEQHPNDDVTFLVVRARA